MRVDGEPGVVQPLRDTCRNRWPGREPAQRRDEVGGGGVGDVVRVRFHVQDNGCGGAGTEQVVGQHQIGDELPAGVVRQYRDPPARLRRQHGTEGGALVGDQIGLVRRGTPVRGLPDAEAEIGPVAPQRRVQQYPGPRLLGQLAELGQLRQVIVHCGR